MVPISHDIVIAQTAGKSNRRFKVEWFLKKKRLTVSLVSIQKKAPLSSSELSALVSESIFYHPAFVVLVRALVIFWGWIDR